MSRKVVVFVALAIVVIAVLALVYKRTNVSQILPTQTSNTTSGETTSGTQETGSVTSTKLSLVVTSPKDGDTLGSTDVVVKGKTAPRADVFVNDQSGKADANGNFSISIGLDEGSNQIVVSANDSAGNAAQKELTVTIASFE